MSLLRQSTLRRVAPLAIAFALVTSGIAHAQTTTARKFASPQNFAAEIKLGPYTPNIDNTVNASPGPFEKITEDSTGIMVQGEFDWQIWHGFGSIGVGFSGGYYHNSGPTLRDNGNDTTASNSNERLAGDSGITLLPLAVLAVYRFDVLAERFNIPLVPYAKLGLNYTFWWITKGDGDLASYQGDEAKGGSWGLQFNLGIALLLDIFEPQSAKSLDGDLGVNHTYAFIELHHAGADRFGADSALDVGDTTFLAGLAFEM
jgi:hypothetical protein